MRTALLSLTLTCLTLTGTSSTPALAQQAIVTQAGASLRCRNNPDLSQRYEASIHVEGSQNSQPSRSLRIYDIADSSKKPVLSQTVSPESQKDSGFVHFTSTSILLSVDYDEKRCVLKAKINGKQIDQVDMLLEN
jgi:hypothetical protein